MMCLFFTMMIIIALLLAIPIALLTVINIIMTIKIMIRMIIIIGLDSSAPCLCKNYHVCDCDLDEKSEKMTKKVFHTFSSLLLLLTYSCSHHGRRQMMKKVVQSEPKRLDWMKMRMDMYILYAI